VSGDCVVDGCIRSSTGFREMGRE